MKFGRPTSFLLVALAAALASCLTRPVSQPESPANAPAFRDAWGDPHSIPIIGTPSRPTPWRERPKAWANDGECLASAPARGADETGTETTDLLIRTVQRSDPGYELIEMGLALDLTVLGTTEGSRLQDPEHFVRVPGVAAGIHTVSVRYWLRGKGTGDLGYMNGYKFKLFTSKTITLAPAQTTCMSILLYFDPDLGRAADERLLVDFREERAPL